MAVKGVDSGFRKILAYLPVLPLVSCELIIFSLRASLSLSVEWGLK